MEKYLTIAIVLISLFIVWMIIDEYKTGLNKQISKVKDKLSENNYVKQATDQLKNAILQKKLLRKKFNLIWHHKVYKWVFIGGIILLVYPIISSTVNISSIFEKEYTDEELAKFNCKELLKTKNARSIREWCGKYSDALSPTITVSKRDLLNGTSKYCGGDAMSNWSIICPVEIHHPNNIIRKEWQRYTSAQIIIRGKLWSYGSLGMMIDNPSFIGYNN